MQLDFLKKQMTLNIVRAMSHIKVILKNLIWNQNKEKKRIKIIKLIKNRNWLFSIDQQHFYLNKVLSSQRKRKQIKIHYHPLQHLSLPLIQKQTHLHPMFSVQTTIVRKSKKKNSNLILNSSRKKKNSRRKMNLIKLKRLK